MKLIEQIQIPLLVMPPPETCRLVKWHVKDGSHVTIGEAIFELEVDGVIWEVESFYTGHIKISVLADSAHKVGDCVASMFCDEDRNDYMTIGIYLHLSQFSKFDLRRGKIPRRNFLSALLVDVLNKASPISEHDAPSDGDTHPV